MDKSPPLLLGAHWVEEEEYQGGQPACACGEACLPALYSALHYCRITLAQFLAQGLHSNDTRILDSVLDRADLELIENTVKRILAEAGVPLVSLLLNYHMSSREGL